MHKDIIMLIITRKEMESIIVNGEIEIIYLGRNRHNQCKFGINGPREIPVHRKEVYERIQLGIPQRPK